MIMDQRFFFRAHAAGAAASVRRMQNQDIPEETLVTQAACSLPVTGGHSEQKVQGSRGGYLDPFLSFESAETITDGKPGPGGNSWVTQVTANLTKVRLAERFTADQLYAQLVSTHWRGGRQPEISWTGTKFVGLQLDGVPVEIVLDAELERMPTEKHLVDAYRTEPFHTTHGARFFERPGGGGPDIPRVGRSNYIGFSIVDKIQTTHPTARIEGHKLTLEGFGSLYFGEMLVTQDSRRLMLVRFALGSPYAGDGTLGDVEGNGEMLP
jgi:hypothetical protein